MEAATAQTEEVKASDSAAPLLEVSATASVQGEQAQAVPAPAAPPSEPTRHLVAVPSEPAQEPQRRAGPPPRGAGGAPQPAPRAQPKERPEAEAAAASDVKRGPSRDQARRFKERMAAAVGDAAATVEALRYGVKVGALTEAELKEAMGEAATAAPATQQAQQAQPQPQQAAAQGEQPAQQAAPAQQPEKPLLHGQDPRAVHAAAEKVHFVVTQFQAWGLASGWGAATPEPIKLFEGTEFEYECQGNPRKRLVELGAVELARMQGSGKGGEDSPLQRRLELGLLAMASFGPGLTGPLKAAVGGVVQRAARVGAFVVGQLRGLRR